MSMVETHNILQSQSFTRGFNYIGMKDSKSDLSNYRF